MRTHERKRFAPKLAIPRSTTTNGHKDLTFVPVDLRGRTQHNAIDNIHQREKHE
jgi:hypothetical protein